MDKAVLDALLERYDWWMGVSTIIVAIGILGEIALPFFFEKEKKPISEVILSVIFGVLVFGGVGGEYIAGTKLSEVTHQRRVLADTEIAQAGKEAAAARLEQEKLRSENLALQRRIQPRQLTVEQQQAIGKALAGFSGQSLDLRSYTLDAEGWGLAQQIKAALGKAEISVEDNSANFFVLGTFIVGVLVAGPSTQQDLINGLKKSLEDDGKLAVLAKMTDQDKSAAVLVPKEDVVTVLVGVKPFKLAH
jgi:hypothetical protein